MVFKPIVSGERIYLREVRESDVNDNYYHWMNDPEISQYLETRFMPRSPQNILDFVKRMDGKADEPFFAICLIAGDIHIGNIKIGPINWYHRNADVSLLIGEKLYWGKGFASEAISLVTRFGFEVLNLNKLKAGCYGENEGSARAFEKAGWKREGVLKEHFLSKGKLSDYVVLGILAKDYFQGKRQ